MAITFLYRGTAACQVAGIAKQRFNEAVAAKKYPCAPEVQKGGTRLFSEDDIVALFIYARLVERGIGPKVAGETACALREKLNENPDVDEVKIPQRIEAGDAPKNKRAMGSFDENAEYSIHVSMVFSVAGVRNEIAPALKKIREGN